MSACDRSGIFPSLQMPPRDSFTHTVSKCGVGTGFENSFFFFLTLDSLSEVVEGGGAFSGMR